MRSAPTHENHRRRGARGVLVNRHRTADTPNLAAQGQSVSRKTVAEVPLTGLSFDWGELVQAHDDRDVFQAAPDELPVIDIHSV